MICAPLLAVCLWRWLFASLFTAPCQAHEACLVSSCADQPRNPAETVPFMLLAFF